MAIWPDELIAQEKRRLWRTGIAAVVLYLVPVAVVAWFRGESPWVIPHFHIAIPIVLICLLPLVYLLMPMVDGVLVLGSVRPTKDQELRAFEGERHQTDDEQALYAQISEALLAVGDVDDRTDLDVEIDRDRVTLRGVVTDAGLITKIEDVVRGVEGVGEVDNQLVVTAS